jgi:hypothetical protein
VYHRAACGLFAGVTDCHAVTRHFVTAENPFKNNDVTVSLLSLPFFRGVAKLRR